MPFTDDELKRLKGLILNPTDVYANTGFIDPVKEKFTDKILALIDRLEAAEAAVKIARNVQRGIEGTSWKYFYTAWGEWLKAAGK